MSAKPESEDDILFITVITDHGDMTIHFPRKEEEKWKQFAANVITGNFPKSKYLERLEILRHQYNKALMFYWKEQERQWMEARLPWYKRLMQEIKEGW